MKFTWFLVVFTCISVSNGFSLYNLRNNIAIVDTEYGQVRGQEEFTLFENKSYFAFRGIPFAEPPVGELRFKVKLLIDFFFYIFNVFQCFIKPPVKAAAWEGIRDTFQFQNVCVQLPDQGDEDCLYLNVYSPSKYRIIFSIIYEI